MAETKDGRGSIPHMVRELVERLRSRDAFTVDDVAADLGIGKMTARLLVERACRHGLMMRAGPHRFRIPPDPD